MGAITCSKCGKDVYGRLRACPYCRTSLPATTGRPTVHQLGVDYGDNVAGISWGRALYVWWSITWRSVLYGAVGGIILGIVVVLLVLTTDSPGLIHSHGVKIAAYVLGTLASILAVKQAIGRHLPTLSSLARHA